ncbi:MAG: hypothetical protein KC917_15715 [Candidatus Omnitrophica bacterium]|nr:hypothetical protein [Candidatus Omnitrophota bacterium]
MKRFSLLLTMGLVAILANPGFGIEDLYEIGSPSIRFQDVTPTNTSDPSRNNTEVYRRWIEGYGFGEHHFSPAYHPSDPDEFWDRVDKQAPSPSTVIHSLWNNPVHLVYDTPVNMGVNLKRTFYDTFYESDSGWEVTHDLVFGLPDTAMVGINGIYDSGTNFYTDVWAPVIGGIFIWPPRLLTGLAKDSAPGFYEAVDFIPKTLWSVALPVRKLGVTVGDQVQKGTNFVYRTITHPTQFPAHLQRYWGEPPTSYSPPTFVPSRPRSSMDSAPPSTTRSYSYDGGTTYRSHTPSPGSGSTSGRGVYE